MEVVSSPIQHAPCIFLVGRSRDGDRKRALLSGLRSAHMKHAVVFCDGVSANIVFKVHPL